MVIDGKEIFVLLALTLHRIRLRPFTLVYDRNQIFKVNTYMLTIRLVWPVPTIFMHFAHTLRHTKEQCAILSSILKLCFSPESAQVNVYGTNLTLYNTTPLVESLATFINYQNMENKKINFTY